MALVRSGLDQSRCCSGDEHGAAYVRSTCGLGNVKRVGPYREKIEVFDRGLAMGYPSMVDSFSNEPVRRKEMLCYFLKRAGFWEVVGGATTRDVFTGEDTGILSGIRNDGVYAWSADLAWYVEKYNLLLPDDFIRHALGWLDRKKEARTWKRKASFASNEGVGSNDRPA